MAASNINSDAAIQARFSDSDEIRREVQMAEGNLGGAKQSGGDESLGGQPTPPREEDSERQ
ncbi:hypothetical protein PCASD_10458 [Puccinia coronata f. sp. avenae]|uniref:Uncharacterized protein n=1 Tax=Puccinia coronata f. sp. avenae TaxID=200324 RepID=A0A2N5UEM8_9BASI|nr:hypothetical protein PCASD_10458 [Puccinia coronata f. sp. avenae]